MLTFFVDESNWKKMVDKSRTFCNKPMVNRPSSIYKNSYHSFGLLSVRFRRGDVGDPGDHDHRQRHAYFRPQQGRCDQVSGAFSGTAGEARKAHHLEGLLQFMKPDSMKVVIYP
jgi:hypothetical protein